MSFYDRNTGLSEAEYVKRFVAGESEPVVRDVPYKGESDLADRGLGTYDPLMYTKEDEFYFGGDPDRERERRDSSVIPVSGDKVIINRYTIDQVLRKYGWNGISRAVNGGQTHLSLGSEFVDINDVLQYMSNRFNESGQVHWGGRWIDRDAIPMARGVDDQIEQYFNMLDFRVDRPSEVIPSEGRDDDPFGDFLYNLYPYGMGALGGVLGFLANPGTYNPVVAAMEYPLGISPFHTGYAGWAGGMAAGYAIRGRAGDVSAVRS